LAVAIASAGLVLTVLVVVWAGRAAWRNVDSFVNTGTGPWQTGSLIEVLEERGSTAARLEAELQRASEVPGREALLQWVGKKRRKIDRLGAERRDDELLDFLSPPDGRPRDGLADFAARDEQRRVVAEVIALVQGPGYLDHFTDRRVEAARSLAFFPGDDGLEALIGVLSDPNESDYLKRAVAESLEQIDDYRARRALEEHASGGSLEQRTAEKGATEERTAGASRRSRELSSASAAVRRRAIETLASQPGGDPVAGLIAALEDPDPELRALAIRGLARRGHHRVEPALLRVIEKERSRSPLLAAVQALQGCREPHRRALLSAYRGAIESNRSFLVGALAACDHRDVVEPILDTMESSDGTVALAGRNALLTLASRGHRRTVGPLVDNLSLGRPPDVQRTMVQVLEHLTGQRLGNDVDGWFDWWVANRFDFES
jgi:hypothetical protein